MERRDTGLALAGPGAPFVSEFAVIELATALGMTVDACRRYVGQVLEVRYRLPLIWRRVAAGDLQWWRAGRIAQHTLQLPEAGAVHVDRRLAAVAHRVGVVQTERLCQEALDTFDPDEAEARRQAAAEARRVDVHTRDADRTGTVEVTATTDLADALDLETALAHAAAELAANGSTEPLDVRRSRALGVIARHYLGDALNTGHQSGPLVTPRQLVIHVHLRDQATGRCDTTKAPISVHQVQGWCTHPDTQVVIRPVRDLNDHIRVDLRGPRPARRPGRTTRRQLRAPLVHPTRHQLRQGPLHPLRARRPHRKRQHRTPVSPTPPRQDPRQLDLPVPQTRPLPVDQPHRPHLLPRRHRHHRPRQAHSLTG